MESLFANHATRASPFLPSGLSRTKGRRKVCLRSRRHERHSYLCVCIKIPRRMPLPLLSSSCHFGPPRMCVQEGPILVQQKETSFRNKNDWCFPAFFPSALGRLVVRKVIFENKIMEVTHASNNVCSCCIFSSSCLYCRREILS